jgi:hypothetical protein
LNVAPFQIAQLATSPWGEVALLYRRICVLRARGHSAEADRLYSTEFAQALEAGRSSTEADPDRDNRLQVLLAAEEERVAAAEALAALLAPLLVEQLRGLLPAGAPDLSPARSGEPNPFTETPVAALVRPAPGTPPAIADLIEGMLAQERAAARTPASRRAS